MKRFSPSDLKRIWGIWSSFRRGRVTLDYFPSRLWLETTSHCNLHCPLCPNRELHPSQRGFMTWDLFRRIVDQAAGRTHDLYLFHRGEPLLHPQLPEMIAYAEKHGLPVRIHTNATLLTPDLGRRLIESGLTLLSFSFDGYNEETYNRNRPPARFRETLARIEEFLVLKRQRNANKMATVLQIMGLPEGKPDPALQALTDRLKSLGLSRVVYRRPHNWGGLVTPAPGSPPDSRRLHCCTFPWYAQVVYWDGTVGPCPQDFLAEMEMGHLENRTLEEIWNGPPITVLRQRLARKEYGGLPVCSRCDRPLRRQLAGVPLEYAKTFLRDQLSGNR